MSYGLPLHAIAARVANGPKSSTPTFACDAPRPETVTVSDSGSPGATTSDETCEVTCGAAVASDVSVVAPHWPVNAAVSGAAAIDSR